MRRLARWGGRRHRQRSPAGALARARVRRPGATDIGATVSGEQSGSGGHSRKGGNTRSGDAPGGGKHVSGEVSPGGGQSGRSHPPGGRFLASTLRARAACGEIVARPIGWVTAHRRLGRSTEPNEGTLPEVPLSAPGCPAMPALIRR